MHCNHQDDFKRTEDLTNPTYVECPKCSGKAIILVVNPEALNMFSPRKLICSKCVFRDSWDGGSHSPSPNYSGRDNHFELPLWLQVSCGKNFLFAYNENHIQMLESYISSDLRSRKKSADSGWCNRSAISRLPAWIKSKRNRALVLKGLNRLKQRAIST